jgi:hypothetical protein
MRSVGHPDPRNPAAADGRHAVLQCDSCSGNPAQNRFDCNPGCAQYWPACCPTPAPGCL